MKQNKIEPIRSTIHARNLHDKNILIVRKTARGGRRERVTKYILSLDQAKTLLLNLEALCVAKDMDKDGEYYIGGMISISYEEISGLCEQLDKIFTARLSYSTRLRGG